MYNIHIHVSIAYIYIYTPYWRQEVCKGSLRVGDEAKEISRVGRNIDVGVYRWKEGL